MNSGFWKAKSGKTFLQKEWHIPDLSKSVQCYAFVRKVRLSRQSPLKPFSIVRTFWQKKGLNCASQWNRDFFFLFQILLIQALKWFLSLNLLLWQTGKWPSFMPREAVSIFLREENAYCSFWSCRCRVSSLWDDTEIRCYILKLSRCHAFCCLRCCFLKVCHNLIWSYNCIVYKGLSHTIHFW